ncbi:M55 family metallopeptidase (plasmid) [Skermanella mucosa]|uniref:M55 family metallopeptidase n=1 Tax=Skermanella mucosa TaxID=1789672 RepID=UPI00192C85F2|nr:M55 family metallopeptidase [Skermanella mucosa]UEM24503.1 M55 family metallopeptidase [Skermanella mucosa]
MNVYICADIEGVAGVVSPEQCRPGNPEYERARRLMTGEVNAAVEGALEAGASAVLVNDAHGPMTNLLPEVLHPAAGLILGKPKPLNMFAGLDGGFDAVFCVGHHARAGGFGVLAHTTNGFAFRAVRVNGEDLGEPGLYGAYAGSLGVPVAMVTGDDRCAAENRGFFPDAELVEVKRSLGNRAARNLPVEAARRAIRDGAGRALARLGEIKPFVIEPPLTLEFEMTHPSLGDLVAVLPPAERLDALRIRLPAASIADAIGWMNSISAMAAFLR